MAYPVSVGQVLEAEILRPGDEGRGVAQVEGLNVFVDRALPGERVRLRIAGVQKRYATAALEAVLRPSPDRVTPPCPYYALCGGCTMQHMRYGASLSLLGGALTQTLQRLGGVRLDLPPVLGMEHPWRYRNKAVYTAAGQGGPGILGVNQRDSHQVVEACGCLLQSQAAKQAAETVQAWMRRYKVAAYAPESGRGLLRQLLVRTSRLGGVMAALVTASPDLPKREALVQELRQRVSGLAGVVQMVTRREGGNLTQGPAQCLWGESALPDTLYGLRLLLSPQSFYQVNPLQTERLYAQVAAYAGLTGRETVLDAYCGAGTIGLTLAASAQQVVGVEIVPAAVLDARENARANGVGNISFQQGACEALLPRLLSQGLRPDVAVLDPPRKGCEPRLLEAVAAAQPARIVYVSCNPATLARDLSRLRPLGYAPVAAQGVDLFPWTGHVETVVLLSKLNTKQHIEVELNLDELDLTSAESKATYEEIKEYVLEKYGLKVSSLYISQVKRKCGLDVGQNYNLSKKEDAKVPQCPPEKEAAIMDALKHFQMI